MAVIFTQSVSPNGLRTIRALSLALCVIAPWLAGIAAGNPDAGSIAAFGAYLIVVSFPSVPATNARKTLLAAVVIFTLFAGVGAAVPFGGPAFFAAAVGAAMAQAVAELRGGPLRLPVALAALAYFLSVAQLPGGAWTFGLLFLGGTLWGAIAAACIQPRADVTPPRYPDDRPAARRFVAAVSVVALCGSVLATAMPSGHPGWLPAAGLRVLKPTRSETLARMKRRGAGTLLGAGFGGVLLGLDAMPQLHAALVAILLFAMLLVGAKRYGVWTFCLTAIALAFDLSPGTSPLPLAVDRVLLTVCGLLISAGVLLMLPGRATVPERGS